MRLKKMKSQKMYKFGSSRQCKQEKPGQLYNSQCCLKKQQQLFKRSSTVISPEVFIKEPKFAFLL